MRRRTFLKLSAFGPAMLARQQLPARAMWLPGAPAADGVSELGAESVFDEEESELLMTIVERMVDTGEPAAPAPREFGTLATLQAALASLDASLVDELRLALHLVDYWPLVFEFRFCRFRSLSAEAQDRSLEGWRSSRIETRRRVFYALRNLSLLGYWSQDETWPLIGYLGPWIRRPA